MRPEILEVALEDFEACDWKNVPNEAKRNDRLEYSSLYYKKALDAENAGQAKVGGALRLLGAVTSTALRAHESSEPFVPEWLATFTDEHLNIFVSLVPDIEDAELKARLCDVVWMRRRAVELARYAVAAYIEAAKTLEEQKDRQSYWRDCADRIERAISISRSLGAESSEFKKSIAIAEETILRINGEDDSLLSAALMEVLQDYEQGDGTIYGPMAEKASERAALAHRWEIARRYLHVEAGWWFQAGQKEEGRRTRLEMAEIHVRQGQAIVAADGAVKYLQACPHLEHAIKALKDIGGDGARERGAEIYQMLREWQKVAVNELRSMPLTIEFDGADVSLREIAVEAVKNEDILSAAVHLGRLPLIGGTSELKHQIENELRTSPIAMLFPFKMHTSTGLVSGRPLEKPRNAEEQLLIEVDHQCHAYANNIRHSHVILMIEPALRHIRANHNLHSHDLRPLVIDNPFIPNGREYLFLKGLYVGVTGDFVTAAHLLIPQVENALRYLLGHHSIMTSSLTRHQTQEWFDINRMLTAPELHDKLVEILGEDAVFHLKGVLVHHFGANLRNELAHGTLGVGELNGFYSSQCVFAWWLTLHLCVGGFLMRLNQPIEIQEDEGTHDVHPSDT